MGNEFAQFIEWNFTQGLDWLLLDYDHHRQMREYVRMLNQFYLKHPAMWENDSDWNGFQWMSATTATARSWRSAASAGAAAR